MRRLLHGVFAASFLIGMLSGCAATHSVSQDSCGTSACSTCGGGGCGSCAGGPIRGLGLICHTAGVCDCDRDEDPCAHRAPWASVRPVSYNTVGPVGGSVGDQPVGAAPVTTGTTTSAIRR